MMKDVGLWGPDDQGIRILGSSQNASSQPCKAPAERENGRSKFGFACSNLQKDTGLRLN